MRELFESTIERLLADLSTPPAVQACEGGGWAASLWQALETSGFTLAGTPEHLGGAGASWDDMFVLVRAAGRFAAPVPLGEALLANWLLGQAGLAGTAGVLSLGARGDLVLANDRVSGTLRAVPWGRHADAVVSLATDGQGRPWLTLLAIDAATVRLPGLNIAGEARDELTFSQAPVLASAPLPAHLSADVLQVGGAMLRSAQMAGALRALLELSVQYVGERKQFGKPIGAFQAIQQQLAVLAEQAAAASMAAEAAFAESREGLADFTIAVAKVSAGDAASQGAAIAHGVHGAIGFTQEYALQLYTRRLWAWRSEFGSLGHWAQRLGRHVCLAGSEAFWPEVTRHMHVRLQEARP